MYIDRISVNSGDPALILSVNGDRYYEGTDLTQKFKTEIAEAPYNGNPWAWIQARIKAGNYAGIHVKDFIPFTTTNSVKLHAEIAGIDTYRNYGSSPVGHHIDFICRELWPTLKPINPVNYNNGISTCEFPWLASDLYHWLNSKSGSVPNGTTVNPTLLDVDYTTNGVYYFLPANLKAVIIEKHALLNKRYSASGLLSSDNSWDWQNIGKLWLPTECEVYGTPIWNTNGYATGGSAVQYPIFAGNMNRVKFRSGSRRDWWLLTPGGSNSTTWCNVSNSGFANAYHTSYTSIASPVCFRVA